MPERRRQGVEQVADRLHDGDVGPLAARPDIVGLAGEAALQRQDESFGVVLDIEPVANVPPRTVDGQLGAFEPAQDHQRDHFLGEMVGAEIVGAVGDERRQPEGFPPGPNQMVGARLRRRIGRTRPIGGGLVEDAGRPERAEHLVGRDVQQPEGRALARIQAAEVTQRLLQQHEGPDHVGLDEGFRAVDRPVDMCLRRKMHHGGRPVALEHLAHRCGVADVALLEGVARVLRGAGQRCEVRRIGQRVDIDHRSLGGAEQPSHHGRADEAGAARDEDSCVLEAGRHRGGIPGAQKRSAASASIGARRSLSESRAPSGGVGQSMPSAGSAQKIARSRSGA